MKRVCSVSVIPMVDITLTAGVPPGNPMVGEAYCHQIIHEEFGGTPTPTNPLPEFCVVYLYDNGRLEIQRR